MKKKSTSNPGYSRIGQCFYRNDGSGIYYAIAKVHGKTKFHSHRTSDRKLAERRHRDYMRLLDQKRNTHLGKNLTFGELADEWLETKRLILKPSSFERRSLSVKMIKQCFAARPARSINRRDCQKWAQTRHENSAPSTFNNERDTLVLIFRHGVESGTLLENPAEAVSRRRGSKRNPVIPSREEFFEILRIARECSFRGTDGHLLIELLAYSGMRVAEARELLWKDIDFEKGHFTVTGGKLGTKNHRERTVPLFPDLRRLLCRIRESRSGEIADQRVVMVRSAAKSLDTAPRRAGIPHLSHHSLRHFFVSNAIENGVDFATIASWVGHSDGGMLVAKTYGHLRNEHSRRMAEKMDLLKFPSLMS